jgi:23S rRNA (uracil1939-C5)-methyltransferase
MLLVMLRQSATDQEIRNWVLREHGLKIEIGWIADCKQECGISVDDVRAFEQARCSPCPPEKRPAIKQAFRHFGMLPLDHE